MPKTMVAAPNPPTAHSNICPARRGLGHVRGQDRHRHRAHRLRGPQPSQAARAGVQDLYRINRKQRRRAAEQHAEQIQRNGGQDQLIRTHKPDAFEQLFAIDGGNHGARLDAAHSEQLKAREGKRRADELDDVHGLASHRRQQQACDRRSTDVGDLLGAAVPGDGVAQAILGDDVRKDCQPRRALEGSRGGGQEQGAVDQRDRWRSADQ